MSDDDLPTILGSPVPQRQPQGAALAVGTRVQEFEIEGLVGEGGFSIVYRAHDTLLGRTIALKEYMPTSLAQRSGARQVQARTGRHRETFDLGLRSFINEARLLASFEHPALVKVYRFWEENGTAYLVMPLYQGRTLREWLGRDGAHSAAQDVGRARDADRASVVSEAGLMLMLHPLLDALEVMHAKQCYHRDIAPDNILLLEPEDGSSPLRPVLLDFGAARRVIGDATQALTVILKPGYAPIEQYAETAHARQGPWTDVYALCATLYHAVSGRVPEPSVARLMHDGLQPAVVVGEGRYSPTFLAAIDRGMAVKPTERPQSVQALRELLRADAAPVAAAVTRSVLADDDSTVILRPDEAAAAFAAARDGAMVGGAQGGAGRGANVALGTFGGDTVQPPNDAAGRQADTASKHATTGGATTDPGGVTTNPTPSLANATQRRPRTAAAAAAVTVAAVATALYLWATQSPSTDGAAAGGATVQGTAPNTSGTAASPPTVTAPYVGDGTGGATTGGATTGGATTGDATLGGSTPSIGAGRAMPSAPFTVLAALQEIAAGADASLTVQTATDKSRLVIGQDKLSFTVEAAQAGYVYVFASGTEQSHFYQLFPNSTDRNNRIDAKRKLRLPRADWSLLSAGPPGLNHVLVLVSRSRRDFRPSGLVAGDGQGFAEFDLRQVAAVWATRTTSGAASGESALAGRTRCDRADNCPQGYGASLMQVEEVLR